MKKKEIVSVFEVTDLRTKKIWREFIDGEGQPPIRWLRGKYPKYTKFVLEGFEIDGTFVQLKLRKKDDFYKTIRKNPK